MRVFEDKIHHREHLVLSKGDISDGQPVLTRVHSACVLGDVFGGSLNLSGIYLRRAIDKINQEKRGVLVYLCLQNGQNHLSHQAQAYLKRKAHESTNKTSIKDKNLESLPLVMDDKDYGVGAQILRALQITQLRLLSNSLKKRVGLKGYGLEIVEMVPLTF